MSGTYRLVPKVIAGGQDKDYIVWSLPRMDLSVDNRVLLPTLWFTVASVAWCPLASWTTAVVKPIVSNNDGQTYDLHPSGYPIGGTTVDNTTNNAHDGIPLEHGWFGLRVTTVQASTLADFWICMKRRLA